MYRIVFVVVCPILGMLLDELVESIYSRLRRQIRLGSLHSNEISSILSWTAYSHLSLTEVGMMRSSNERTSL